MAVLVAGGGDSLDEEPYQFAPFLESLRGMCFDLRHALPEGRKSLRRALDLYAGYSETGESLLDGGDQ
jgi:hypothetical protein